MRATLLVRTRVVYSTDALAELVLWELPKPLTAYDAAEAAAYRWQAMGNHYLRAGLARTR